MKELPIAGCIRHLDDILMAMKTAPEIGKPFAQWASSGEEIIADGKFVGKTTCFAHPATGLRWHCPARGSKGMFGKGIALYGYTHPTWLESMPTVR